MNREEYEAKLEAKKERMLERADRAAAEARAAAAAAGAIADRIPMGQPILVGHHSERRHRKDLERIDRNMRKASDAAGRAESLRRRAAKVGETGVSSEDPDAVEKLEAKLAELEASRERMKDVNAAYRRGGWYAVRAAGLLNEEQIAEVARLMRFVPGGTDKPFPTYAFSNTTSEIGRLKKRIEELAAGPPSFEPIEGHGWRIEPRPDLHRVAITFESKPSAEITTKLKRGGWRWSPRQGAWLRLLNKASLWAVQEAAKYLPAKPAAAIASEAAPPTPKAAPPTPKLAPPTPKAAAPKAKAVTPPISKAAPKAKAPAPAPKTDARASKAATTKANVAPTATAPKGSSKPATKSASRKEKAAADAPAFARFITHPVTRVRLDARDYGLKAWPLRSEKKKQ